MKFMCNKKSTNMDTDTNEPFDLNAFKEAKIMERAGKWDEFYDRYENMGDVGTDEVDWDEGAAYSDDEKTSNDSSASNNETDDNSDDDQEESAIEVSSDDSEMSNDDVANFTNVFKNICHQGMETIQHNYEERLRDEITSKDGSKRRVERHTISSVNESRSQQSTPIQSMNRNSSPFMNIKSRQAIAGSNGSYNDGKSLALVPFNGAKSHGTDIMNMNDTALNQLIPQNGATYHEQTITETIVKTTVIKTMIMQSGATPNSAFTTPLKGDTNRQISGETSLFPDDFDENLTTQETPTANGVRRRYNRRSSTSTSTSIHGTPMRKNWLNYTIATPDSSGGKNRRLNGSFVSGKDLTKSLPKALLNTPAERERLKERTIAVKGDEHVTVVFQTPQKSQKAITSNSEDDDLFMLGRSPLPMVIKNVIEKDDS